MFQHLTPVDLGVHHIVTAAGSRPNMWYQTSTDQRVIVVFCVISINSSGMIYCGFSCFTAAKISLLIKWLKAFITMVKKTLALHTCL